MGGAYAVAGKRAEAEKILVVLIQVSKQKHVSALEMALLDASLGEKELALSWLERAYQEHSGFLEYTKVTPRLDRLRLDPRFKDILRRMNFPE